MCLAPRTPFRPILPSAPASLPPHTPFRPILPSAPYSRPPHTPVRPRLGSTPGSLPPQAPPTPLLALRACVGCQRILTSRSQVWRRGACQLAYIDARCMLSCASAPRLICCRVAGWHVVALDRFSLLSGTGPLFQFKLGTIYNFLPNSLPWRNTALGRLDSPF